MPDMHDLEARVQLLERALAILLGTDDFEAFLTEPHKAPPTPATPPKASETPEHPGSTAVTNASSPATKLRLSADYFRGREDVYATAWHNGEKRGWSPASYGRYDRNNPNLKPLTPQVLEQHLRRDNTLHVGLYPLCKGGTCFLLACDFDDANFRTAARLYADACREYGLDPPHRSLPFRHRCSRVALLQRARPGCSRTRRGYWFAR